jgi:hypothetical protein
VAIEKSVQAFKNDHGPTQTPLKRFLQ